MAKQRKEVVNADYLKPWDGAFRKFVKEPNQFSKPRELSNGRVIHEELFQGVSGKLKQIYVYDNVFTGKDGQEITQPTLVVKLESLDENGKPFQDVVQTPFEFQFAQSFMNYLPGIDLSKEVTLKAYTVKNEAKSKEKGQEIYNDFMIPYQGKDQEGKDLKVERYFTKENPNGLPEIVITRDKKGAVKNVNSVERFDFLKELVTQVNVKLGELSKPAAPVITEEIAEAGESDDLAF